MNAKLQSPRTREVPTFDVGNPASIFSECKTRTTMRMNTHLKIEASLDVGVWSLVIIYDSTQ
jgi:hypothetical protein